tara:strand:- start:551 stop:661 length:111 start_codon:yes stop_codon:yes gene_type:complete
MSMLIEEIDKSRHSLEDIKNLLAMAKVVPSQRSWNN